MKPRSRAGNEEALADAQAGDVANAVGSRDLLGRHLVAEADAIEVLAALDVMDDAGATRSTPATSRHREQETEQKYAREGRAQSGSPLPPRECRTQQGPPRPAREGVGRAGL